jgi:uncharacterized membrane protein YciS (DUF1049 family)
MMTCVLVAVIGFAVGFAIGWVARALPWEEPR